MKGITPEKSIEWQSVFNAEIDWKLFS